MVLLGLVPVLTLIVVAALIARELVRRRMRRRAYEPEELLVSWLPADALTRLRAEHDELTGGPRVPRPQRPPLER